MIKCTSDTVKRDGCLSAEDLMEKEGAGGVLDRRCQDVTHREVHLLGKGITPKIEKA